MSASLQIEVQGTAHNIRPRDTPRPSTCTAESAHLHDVCFTPAARADHRLPRTMLAPSDPAVAQRHESTTFGSGSEGGCNAPPTLSSCLCLAQRGIVPAPPMPGADPVAGRPGASPGLLCQPSRLPLRSLTLRLTIFSGALHAWSGTWRNASKQTFSSACRAGRARHRWTTQMATHRAVSCS